MTPEDRAHQIVERCKSDPEIIRVIQAAMLVDREAIASAIEAAHEHCNRYCVVNADFMCWFNIVSAIRARS